MIVKTYEGLAGSKNETMLGNGRAVTRRFLLAEDGVGFTLSDIRMKAGETAPLHYKNHIEANYIIEGEGVLEELDTGVTHELKPGVMYCLDQHERHRIICKTAIRMICVFNPPLAGGEVHDDDGAYPITS
ncbi:MAG: cupin domain-containing protein [Alphaproteobacteria bacterium]|nr:cupin domain-containing protein [Alphaproteobacteria bacterium]